MIDIHDLSIWFVGNKIDYCAKFLFFLSTEQMTTLFQLK